MKRLALIAALCLLPILVNGAGTYLVPASELYPDLRTCDELPSTIDLSSINASKIESCSGARGYVKGVYDHWESGMAFSNESTCIPNDIVDIQLGDVVYKWMKENPEKRNRPAWAQVVQAILANWPCPKETSE